MIPVITKIVQWLPVAVVVAAGLHCSGVPVVDTETGSEVENGLVISVNGNSVAVQTGKYLPVVLTDAEYTPFDTSRSMVSRRSDLNGALLFDTVASGRYTVIVVDSSTGEGALLSDISVSENAISTAEAPFRKLGVLSGVVTIVKNSQIDTITSGSIGLVGTPLSGALVALHDDPDGYLFTMDHVPEGTYRFAVQVDFSCTTCSSGASSYNVVPDHRVTVIAGAAVRDTLTITAR